MVGLSNGPLNPDSLLRMSGWFVTVEGEIFQPQTIGIAKFLNVQVQIPIEWGMLFTADSYDAFVGLRRYINSVRPPDRQMPVPTARAVLYYEGEWLRIPLARTDEHDSGWRADGSPVPRKLWIDEWEDIT